MKKSITLEQAMPLMVEMLAAGKEVTFVPSGSSMLPLIHGGKDKITLKKPVLPPAKYDVPLPVTIDKITNAKSSSSSCSFSYGFNILSVVESMSFVP